MSDADPLQGGMRMSEEEFLHFRGDPAQDEARVTRIPVHSHRWLRSGAVAAEDEAAFVVLVEAVEDRGGGGERGEAEMKTRIVRLGYACRSSVKQETALKTGTPGSRVRAHP